MNSFGLYLHIPFCVQKCAYCDFLSAPADEAMRERYVSALVREISIQQAQHIDSIFFGGGTPSVLTAAQTERILDAVYARHSVEQDAEITTECNPATADFNQLSAYRKMGINRLSIGVQSFHDAELKLLGRVHDSAAAKVCITDAKNAGFENINLDLMSGIPKQTVESFEENLHIALSYEPTHISAYSLIVEPDTPFEKLYADGRDLPDEDSERAMYARTGEILDAHGFVHYEISNYAKSGFESRHNLKYWHCSPYLAAGLGAHGFDGSVRTENVRDLTQYLQMLEGGKAPIAEQTKLTQADLASEYIMMALRLKEGISLSAFSEKFGYDFYDAHKKKLELYIQNGFMVCKDGRIAFTKKGIQVSNSILCELI